MHSVLEVTNLTKRYGEYTAVDQISFDIKEGEILGLLGANGAGKSTTIQMLLGLTEPNGGEIKYFGKNFADHRESCLSRLNFASAYSELQGRMSIYQNLKVYAALYQVPKPEERIAELLRILEIEAVRDVNFWKVSSGQKTRAILAKALLNNPKMLLMDEPTASLDPDIINKIIDLIKELQVTQKMSILFTSHNMDEVTRLCDRVAFLVKGKIVALDTPLQLTKLVGKTKLVITYEGKKTQMTQYLETQSLAHHHVRNDVVEISVAESEIPGVLFGLKGEEIWVTNISIEQPSLEDVFLMMARKNAV
ncbi:MAG TPA: ABC transporter ATP-binding protein [Vitreimonas sp.]|nr:ABC transporter ATP-binding protein [Vitreimonas sp.]